MHASRKHAVVALFFVWFANINFNMITHFCGCFLCWANKRGWRYHSDSQIASDFMPFFMRFEVRLNVVIAWQFRGGCGYDVAPFLSVISAFCWLIYAVYLIFRSFFPSISHSGISVSLKCQSLSFFCAALFGYWCYYNKRLNIYQRNVCRKWFMNIRMWLLESTAIRFFLGIFFIFRTSESTFWAARKHFLTRSLASTWTKKVFDETCNAIAADDLCALINVD